MKHLGPRSSSGCLQEGWEDSRRGAVSQKGEPSSSSGPAPGRTGSQQGKCAPWVLSIGAGGGETPLSRRHSTSPQRSPRKGDGSFSREEQSQLGRPTFLRLNSAGTVTSICSIIFAHFTSLHNLELRSKPCCLYFSGSSPGEDILIPPILRHRKAPLFVQALVSLESSFLSLYKCWWTNVLLCVCRRVWRQPPNRLRGRM